jgi:L-iditol 2-dehydrogenase
MKAVQITAPGVTTITEAPVPDLKPGKALIRTRMLSLCGSDLRHLYNLPPEAYPSAPGATGHEMVGIVEAVADPNAPVKVGDVALTLAPDHYAMAEYYSAPYEHVLVLPTNRTPEEFLQAQQLGTVIYACRELPSLVGKDVVVIGQGSAGLWFNFMTRRLGANRVIAIDLEPSRLELSSQYGATHTLLGPTSEPAERIREITGGALVDVVIEAAGEDETVNLGIDLLRDYAFLLYFGVPRSETLTFRFRDFFMKCLRAKAIVHASREQGQHSTKIALSYIENGIVDVTPILTHRFPFNRVSEAYNLARTREDGAVKIIIDMPA